MTTTAQPPPTPPKPRKPAGSPSRDGDGDLLLPPSAVGFSWTYAGPDGKPVTSGSGPVPVNDANERTHIELVCDDCPGWGIWLKATSRAALACPVHHVPLRPAGQRPAATGTPIPWDKIWDSQRDRFRAFALPTAATLTAGIVLDQADMPWWGDMAQFGAAGAVVWGSWFTAKFWLEREEARRVTRRANAGEFEYTGDEDEITGERRRKRLAKRARHAGYCGLAAALWVEVADVIGIDITQPSGIALVGALVGAGIAGSRPYLKWADEAKKARPVVMVPDEDPVDDTPQPTNHDLLVAYVQERWRKLSAPGKKLAGTGLEAIQATAGDGWSAVVIADEDSDLDPEKYSSDATIRMIARAYNVGTSMVSITADPLDANKALILVQRNSPLSNVRTWNGVGIDPATGAAETMTADDGTRVLHRFWRPGWGAVMELLAGCTGSGKSEYLNLLLAMEKLSGLVVSWVADPQMGQSLGDLRDGVDWFAPTTEELLFMLQCAVAVMLGRNLITTRLRVTETRADGRVVERRVKYVEVSAERPLLSLTVDEAHIPMNDPDLGRQIVKLLALLSKSGRKSNIKLRLIVQSPLLSELKDSVLRAQLSSGLVVVFRTADKLSGAAAWPGKMPADPAGLPAEWPDGTTAAGVCYMSTAKPMRLRADYVGDVYDLMTNSRPFTLEDAVTATAGPVYRDRHKRLAAFDSMDPAELLGAGIPAGLLNDGAPPGDGDGKVGGREAVLRFLMTEWVDGNHDPIPFGKIADAVKQHVKTRACTNACNKLVEEQIVEKVDGGYRLTGAGAEQLDLADEREEAYA